MDFWQTQLIFATWCTTTGCGVSVHDHLNGLYVSPRRVHSYRSRYSDFTCTTRTDEFFTKYAPHCRQTRPGTRLTMPTTTQPTKRSATSSVWTNSRGTATGEQPGGHNGWPTCLALTWTDSEFTLRVTRSSRSTLTAVSSTLCWTRHRD